MKISSIGVIGAGYWGPNLIRNFFQIPAADMRIVCDTSQERLEHIKRLYPGIQTTRNAAELIQSDIDAVVIATPVSTHYELARACLKAGKHILVEKPIASTSVQAKELINLGKSHDLVVMSGHTFLFNPAVEALKTIITSGEIGKIFYINCTRVNLGLYQPDVNVVWDLAPHDLSILIYILGTKPGSDQRSRGNVCEARDS